MCVVRAAVSVCVHLCARSCGVLDFITSISVLDAERMDTLVPSEADLLRRGTEAAIITDDVVTCPRFDLSCLAGYIDT